MVSENYLLNGNHPLLTPTRTGWWILVKKTTAAQRVGFPGRPAGKGSTCNARDPCSIPGTGRSPGGGHGNSLQYSCLENPHGQSYLAGYSPGDGKESDMTERLSITQHGPESSNSVWENNFFPLYFSGHFTILFFSNFFKVVEINQFGERNREKQRSKNTRKVIVLKVWEKEN